MQPVFSNDDVSDISLHLNNHVKYGPNQGYSSGEAPTNTVYVASDDVHFASDNLSVTDSCNPGMNTYTKTSKSWNTNLTISGEQTSSSMPLDPSMLPITLSNPHARNLRANKEQGYLIQNEIGFYNKY